MKKLLVVILVLVMLVGMVGCSKSMPIDDYNYVVALKNNALRKNEKLEKEVEELKKEVEELNQKISSNMKEEESSSAPTSSSSGEQSDNLGFGDTFIVSGMEYTLGTDYTFVTVQNQYSDHNGADVVEIPVHVKNISGETKMPSFYNFTFFGIKGTKLEIIHSYFDNNIFSVGDMRDGAENDGAIHFLYDGDGTYYIETDDYKEKLELAFNITKP